MRTLQLSSALLALAALAVPTTGQLLFGTPRTLDAQPGVLAPMSLRAGDVDGDGLTDLVLHASVDGDGTHVYLNTGSGDGTPTALPPQVLVTDSVLRAAADLDDDGDLDLVFAAGGTTGPNLSVALGAGDGSFAPAVDLGAGLDPDLVTAADLDADGDLDLVTVRGGVAIQYQLFSNDGAGGFSPAGSLTAPGTFFALSVFLEVFDQDGDGPVDIVSGHAHGPVLAHRGLGGGLFDENEELIADLGGVVMGDALLTDLDGDGTADLAWAASNLLSTRLGLGDGSFAPTSTQAQPAASPNLGAGDVDGDGQAELLLSSGGSPAAVQTLRRDGSGSYDVVAATTPSTQLGQLALLDLDGDGQAELAGVNAATAPGFVFQAEWLPNLSYPAGGPWLDRGQATPGTVGYPLLVGTGALTSGTPWSVDLLNGPPGVQPFLVLGATLLDVPFKGGRLFPEPTLIVEPAPFDAQGTSGLANTLPLVAVGFDLQLQAWFPDVGAIQGWASTTGATASFAP